MEWNSCWVNSEIVLVWTSSGGKDWTANGSDQFSDDRQKGCLNSMRPEKNQSVAQGSLHGVSLLGMLLLRFCKVDTARAGPLTRIIQVSSLSVLYLVMLA